MKKIVSILLAVVMIFSLTATVALAADAKPVKITFLDDRGAVMKEINVAYGEDYTSKAPVDTYIDGGYKYFISGWESDHPALKGQVFEKLPVIAEKDKITALTFKASYSVVEVTPDNVIDGVVDGIFGENTTDMFGSLIELVKSFFQQFIMFIMNFIAV